MDNNSVFYKKIPINFIPHIFLLIFEIFILAMYFILSIIFDGWLECMPILIFPILVTAGACYLLRLLVAYEIKFDALENTASIIKKPFCLSRCLCCMKTNYYSFPLDSIYSVEEITRHVKTKRGGSYYNHYFRFLDQNNKTIFESEDDYPQEIITEMKSFITSLRISSTVVYPLIPSEVVISGGSRQPPLLSHPSSSFPSSSSSSPSQYTSYPSSRSDRSVVISYPAIPPSSTDVQYPPPPSSSSSSSPSSYLSLPEKDKVESVSSKKRRKKRRNLQHTPRYMLPTSK